MSRRASVQTSHLGLKAIADGIVQLADGQYRAVLEVSSINFGLQGEGEQEAIIASYDAFLNSLTYPIQMLIRVLSVDVEGYLADLEHRARQELPERLAALARDHVAFLRRLARSRTLLERRFYLVVPAGGDPTEGRRTWLLGRRRSNLDLAAARRQLTFRCEEIERQLGRCGLTVRRLGDTELAQLYYTCWCPEQARVQRLHHELVEYTALVVHASRPEGRRA